MAALDPKVRWLLCEMAIPVAKIVIAQVEDEVRESRTPYDDLALEIVEILLNWAETNLCGSGEA